MSWLFKKSSSSQVPEPTALQTQKCKQIEQLKAANQNVSEIVRDVDYRVNFVVNGCTFSLYITLPPQFPQDKPQVKIAPAVQHPWVNEHMYVVGCPAINSFMVHSDLGKVIRHLIEEFTVHPPQIRSAAPYGGLPPPAYPLHPTAGQVPMMGHYNPGYPSYMPPAQQPPTLGPSGMPNHQTPYSHAPVVSSAAAAHTAQATCMVAPALKPPQVASLPNFHPPRDSVLHQDYDSMVSSSYSTPRKYTVPEVPLSFSKLSTYSTTDLQELADNEDKLLQLVMELPELLHISSDREKLCQSNEQQANDNLRRKPDLEEKKRMLLEKYDELNDLRHIFDDNLKKQEDIREIYDSRTLQNNLKIAAMQADEESEQIAEQFIDGVLSVKEFHRQYVDIRKLGHLRRAKEEKLANYISQNG